MPNLAGQRCGHGRRANALLLPPFVYGFLFGQALRQLFLRFSLPAPASRARALANRSRSRAASCDAANIAASCLARSVSSFSSRCSAS